MTLTIKRRLELQHLASEMERWDRDDLAGDQTCMSCGSSIHIPSDLEPTPLCHGCAHAVAAELHALLSEIRELEKQLHRADPGIDDLLAEFTAANTELHVRWTNAVGSPGYDKAVFRDEDNALSDKYRAMARKLGYQGPLIRGRVRLP